MNYQKELDKIFAKNKLKGKDLGRAYLLDYVYKYENGTMFYVDPAELEQLGSVLSEVDYREHLAGYKLASSFPGLRNIANAYIQQYLKGYEQLLFPLQAVYNAEKVEASQANTPLILTESAYKRLKKEAVEEKRQEVLSVYDVVIYFLDYVIKQLENGEAPAIPSNILEAIEATKSQPVENNYIIRSWNKRTRSGDYGRFSEEKPQTKTDVLKAVNEKSYFIFETELLRGVDYITEKYNIPAELINRIPKEHQEALFSYILLNKTELNNAILASYDSVITELKSVMYTSNPDNIFKCIPVSKYDVLIYAKSYFLLDNLIKEDTAIEALSYFLSEYKELFKACKSYLLDILQPQLKLDSAILATIPPMKPLLSIGLLADSGIDVFKEQLKLSNQDIIKYYLNSNKYEKTQASYKGIAVLSEESDIETVKGIYKAPVEINNGVTLETLKANEDKLDNIKLTKKDIIKPSISQVLAFNLFLDITGHYFNVDLSPVKIDLSYFENLANDNYNSLLAYYYCNVVGTTEEKQVKRSMIKELFPFIDFNNYIPTEERVEAFRKQLEALDLQKDIAFFNNPSEYIDKLAGAE